MPQSARLTVLTRPPLITRSTLPLRPPSPPIERPDVERERMVDEEIGGVTLVVDREKLAEVIKNDLGKDAERIEFLGSGTFHKAYLVTFSDKEQIVARVARPYFPYFKTASEVATMSYLSSKTPIPVPEVFSYATSTDNVLKAEYTLISVAPGIKLSSVPEASLTTAILQALVKNLARLFVQLASHRFSKMGSLYYADTEKGPSGGYEVGAMVSWPFFGNGRGARPINRGPWTNEQAYLDACAKREIDDVRREEELAKAASSGSASTPSISPTSSDDDFLATEDEDDESLHSAESYSHEILYRAYRASQSLVPDFQGFGAPSKSRIEQVEEDMQRFLRRMASLGAGRDDDDEFTFDLHDIRAENVFVEPEDLSRITCIIDFESITLRPLWHAAHMPAMIDPPPPPTISTHPSSPCEKTPAPPKSLPASPFDRAELRTAFREEATVLDPRWAQAERDGRKRRIAHRCLEWDGWEVGLIDSILGSLDKQ